MVHYNCKTHNLEYIKKTQKKTQVFSSKFWREIANAHTSSVRGGLIYSLPWLPCYLCGTNGQDVTSPPQGAQTGFQECQLFCLCCCWTCHQQWPRHCLGWDLNNRLQPAPAFTMCTGGMHIRSQPHPLNRERGNLPSSSSSAYDRLLARTAPDTGSACISNFPPKL